MGPIEIEAALGSRLLVGGFWERLQCARKPWITRPKNEKSR